MDVMGSSIYWFPKYVSRCTERPFLAMNSIFRMVHPILPPEWPTFIWFWTRETISSSPQLNINPWFDGGLYSERYFHAFISFLFSVGVSLARITARIPSFRLAEHHESFIYEKSHALASAIVSGQYGATAAAAVAAVEDDITRMNAMNAMNAVI